MRSRLLRQIDELDEKIDGLDRKIRASAREDEETARLMTIPGIGPITAMALQAFAPPMESFRRGRDFSAWLGLVPRQHTTGGKPRLGRISKMGQRDLRRLRMTGKPDSFDGKAREPARHSSIDRDPNCPNRRFNYLVWLAKIFGTP
ncbi:MAG: IS110 family transposase [Gemmatimonadetes bacterium]|nr:IS110 family transposase [Gemmatimonadota bacterium]MYE94517.1 IS110 family transposase [Gemmatimonadota bacterium]MYJ10639.1 IS110 family transposase [Gemmatimonadota bacterium]